MTQSFDDAWKENRHVWESTKNLAKAMYLAGQQSKQGEVDKLQTEIDNLQKRIDEIINHVEISYDENRDDDSHSYWSGYNQALRELFEILKGYSHES